MNYVEIVKCRTCHSERLLEVLDLGIQPLANALKANADNGNEPKYPLRLVQCAVCGLIQIDVNVSPNLMFSNYNWVTGTSKSSTDHCQNFAARALEALMYHPKTVLEIGSNDGTLLRAFAREEVELLVGVDPAENLTQDYGVGIAAENLFFNTPNSQKLLDRYGKFDIVIARNVFSHIPDFNDVISGVELLLHPNSIFLMEFHWAYDILLNLHYDSIYHEHTYYHSLSSVGKVFENYGLRIFDAFKSPISGGSLVVVSSLANQNASSNLIELSRLESSAMINDHQPWKKFGEIAHKNISELRNIIDNFADKRICAFGASARSSTILNAIGSKSKKILSIAENNPRKWGQFSPGTGIPIESLEEMLSRNPDLIILFPFNFKVEILQQISKSGWSGSVLLPIPHPPQIIKV